MDKNKLEQAVIAAASNAVSPAGEKYMLLLVAATGKLAAKYQLSAKQVEITALESGIIPERYQRSIGSIGINGQISLLKATVGVIGAGGLGGGAIELLARMGIGRLVVVDNDTFSDSNLNRQFLSTEHNFEQPKAEAAAKRVAAVNSSVDIEFHKCRGTDANMTEMFADCDLVIDCLDNLSSRFALEKACHKLGIIMIHGAIAGFLGQLAVIRPDKPLLSLIYGPPGEGSPDRGVEVQLGNPAATPAMLSAWQVSEAVKILAGIDGVLPPEKMLIIDMQSCESYQVSLTSLTV